MKITVPTLLLNEEKCLANMKFMADKANRHHLIFRPHLKTPQSIKAASWYKNFGVDKVTVSSLRMAEYFAGAGWNDITVAFPVNILEIERINSLAQKITLNILVTSKDIIAYLNTNLFAPVNYFIKIDTGTHRTGVNPESINEIDEIIYESKQSDKLIFKGFLAHSGHTYRAKSKEEIHSIHSNEIAILKKLKEHYKKDSQNLIISAGDTPACSLEEDFPDIDEIRPGNFAFYDLQQWKIGSCSLEQIAVCMACPVVSKNEERKEILIYGGGVHFSKECGTMRDGTVYYGLPVKFNSKGWEMPDGESYVRLLSQEHGVINASDELFNEVKIGSVIGILPIHSCMTADCMKKYYTLDDEEILMMTY